MAKKIIGAIYGQYQQVRKARLGELKKQDTPATWNHAMLLCYNELTDQACSVPLVSLIPYYIRN
jgi:hypothetical protein